MSLPKYEEYRHSSIEWQGEVPTHWSDIAIKRVARLPITNGVGEAGAFEDPAWPRYLRITDIAGPRTLRDDTFKSLPPDVASQAPVERGDLLVAAVGATFGKSYLHVDDIGPCCYAGYLIRFSPVPQVEPRFVAYWTESQSYWAQVQSRVVQSTVQNFSAGKFRELGIVLPSRPEQQAIADFLDSETANIGSLIAEQEKLLALLAEKRQATISHVVTRGLDPNVPMKDSSIPWLGKVPAHWQLLPLKQITDPQRPIMYGIVLPGPDVGEGIPILKGGNVKPTRMRLDEMARTTPEIEAPYARARLKEGDLVYSIRGSIGDCEIVPAELAGSNITQDVARVAVDNHYCASWVRWALLSAPIREELASGSLGAAVRGVNIFDLKRVRLPTPPKMAEQEAIAAFLDAEASKFDQLQWECERAIALLREHRSALISAAVTGKIDVRNAMRREAQAA